MVFPLWPAVVDSDASLLCCGLSAAPRTNSPTVSTAHGVATMLALTWLSPEAGGLMHLVVAPRCREMVLIFFEYQTNNWGSPYTAVPAITPQSLTCAARAVPLAGNPTEAASPHSIVWSVRKHSLQEGKCSAARESRFVGEHSPIHLFPSILEK